ncbi:hypothetical protein C8C96_4827 [Acidovorax sp. 100]|nr:hypothetical protein C8C96_4827 [Acidovorax sp. 100]
MLARIDAVQSNIQQTIRRVKHFNAGLETAGEGTKIDVDFRELPTSSINHEALAGSVSKSAECGCQCDRRQRKLLIYES